MMAGADGAGGGETKRNRAAIGGAMAGAAVVGIVAIALGSVGAGIALIVFAALIGIFFTVVAPNG